MLVLRRLRESVKGGDEIAFTEDSEDERTKEEKKHQERMLQERLSRLFYLDRGWHKYDLQSDWKCQEKSEQEKAGTSERQVPAFFEDVGE